MSTVIWTGGAAPITQRDMITISGTWVAGETVNVAIGGNGLTLTVGASTATASVAEALAAAINATSHDSGLIGSETRTVGGQQIPAMREVTAASSGSVVTVTANGAGVPFTLTVTPSTSSGGAAATTSAVATGPNFFDNALNFADGVVPASGDTLVFQHSNVDCLYNLDASNTTNISLIVDATYIGRIGLKRYNDGGYQEYRQRHLALRFASAERSIVIGQGNGSGSSRLNIDVSTSEPKALVVMTSAPEARAQGAVDFKGGGSSFEVSIRRGYVSIAGDRGDSATVGQLDVSFVTNVGQDANVFVGGQAVISGITKNGGKLTMMNVPSTSSISTVTHVSGEAEFGGAEAVSVMNLQGGNVFWSSVGTLGTVQLSGSGVLDFSRDLRTKTVSNPIDRYSNTSRVVDPNKVVTNLRIDNNFIGDMSGLDLGSDFRITRAATA
jgi:hypothetical protein